MSAPLGSGFTCSSSTCHRPHPGGIGRVGLDREVATERGLRFGRASLLHQLNAVRTPGLGRRVRIRDRGGIALRRSLLVTGTVAQAPDFALVEAEQAVPAVLRQSLDEVLAGAWV